MLCGAVAYFWYSLPTSWNYNVCSSVLFLLSYLFIKC
uniref:Uncharacterized protein n=1 Tax=Anguilla anguilla TaxID=7936 RepID=A0A0E9SZ32_ANGAN